MPQPLNRVIQNGEFKPNESVLNNNPELAKLVASIFGLWASIQHSLSLLLTSVLGADAEPAIALKAQEERQGWTRPSDKSRAIRTSEISRSS